jgi:small subunit ribosomal protein S16
LERVGFYNPVAAGNEQKIELKLDRIQYWMSVGARPSARVHHLLETHRPEPAAA